MENNHSSSEKIVSELAEQLLGHLTEVYNGMEASELAEQLLRPLTEVCSGMKGKLSGGDGSTPFILHRKQWSRLLELFSSDLEMIKRKLEDMVKPVIDSLHWLSFTMEAARKSFEECIAPHARGYFRDGSSGGRGTEEQELVWTGPESGEAEEEEEQSPEEEEEQRKRRREDLRVWMAKHALRHILDHEVPHRHADNFRTASLPVFIHLCPKYDIRATMRKSQETISMSSDRDNREARAFFHHEEIATIDISQLLLCRLQDDENLEAAMEPLFVDRAQFHMCDDDIGSGDLGEGGFGSVKLRKWISDDHHVAVKKGDLGRQEIRIQARVRHPNVLPLLCCCSGKRRGGRGGKEQMFLPVMERMDSSLDKLSTGPRSQLILKVEMMLQIAKGMEYLHSLDIIHRDLKPPNILVSGYPDDAELFIIPELPLLRVKVADFGVSKMNFQTSDSSNTLKVGTGFYRAPEVLEEYSRRKWRIGQISRSTTSGGYSRKADVYSFAMVCYRILTGKEPFHGDPRSPNVLRQKIRDEALRPKLDFECWPASLVGMVEECWHRDASRRPEFVEIVKFLRFLKVGALLYQPRLLFMLRSQMNQGIDTLVRELLLSRSQMKQLIDALQRKELFREFRHIGSDSVESV